MIRSCPRLWQILGFGLAFLIGCLFALLYNTYGAQSGTVQFQQKAVGNWFQYLTGDKVPNQNGDSLLNQNGAKNQARTGSGRLPQRQEGAEAVELPAVVETEPVVLPEVKSVLQPAGFGSTWNEDPNLTNLRKYGVVENVPGMDVLNTYNVHQLSAIYHSYLDNSDILCHRKLRMGQVGNCGWEVCDDYEWRPIRPCVIYSFGINYEFSFDDDAGRIYGCDVYSFDPSMSKQPTYRRTDRVMFYRLGIGGKSGEPQKLKNGWVLHSLSNFRAMLNHTKTVIDVLKMDVEGSEWASMTTMLKEGQLRNVRQFLVEYHQTSDDAATLRSRLKIIGDLERAGFKKFYITKNPSCARKATGIPIKRTSCYEVHYVNANFRRSSSVTG